MQPLKIKKLNKNAMLPSRATPGSAGLDIYACMDAPLTLRPGEAALIPTGIAIAIPDGYAAFIYARSGLASKHGVALANGVGVIDGDYRGELKLALLNLGGEEYTLHPGDRAAQMVIAPVHCPPIEEAAQLDDTLRGQGGFGSTGVTVSKHEE